MSFQFCWEYMNCTRECRVRDLQGRIGLQMRTMAEAGMKMSNAMMKSGK